MNKLNKKIGILGGGQLGKMLLQASSRWTLDVHVMDKDAQCPAALSFTNFQQGDINDFETVYNFGKGLDVLTIEIENVNVDALELLQKDGVEVYPQPEVLRVVRDKGKQKMFYESRGFATSEFSFFKDHKEILAAVESGKLNYPFVQKLRSDGYDGKGVCVVRSEADLDNLLCGATLVEDMVDLAKEIAVIVARNSEGEITTYPSVEMSFHPTANLVEFLFSPSELSTEAEEKCQNIASELAQELGIVGLLAVELFVDTSGNILINEIAPRPHNSGHHTIEACSISQYEMHWRCILGLPLDKPSLNMPAAMINLLGEPGYQGKPIYENFDICIKDQGVHPHIYGKQETKSHRKMGHVTITGWDIEVVKSKAKYIQKTLKVKA